MKVEYHPLTIVDLNNSVSYYNQQHIGLGEEFRKEVYEAIARIQENPLQYAITKHDIRRCFVHRFPYSVLFHLVGKNIIYILVIRHHRRHLKFGLNR